MINLKNQGFPFSLFADNDKKSSMPVVVSGIKNTFKKNAEGIKRITFVINENGIIDQIFRKVDSKDHKKQVLEKIN